MSDIAHGKTEAQSPQSQLIQMATAHWVSRFLYVAARMNLADQLAKQPKTAEELAQATGAAAPSLHRLMRTLASLGLFTEDSEHRFSLTRLGEALQTGTPGSARASVLTLAKVVGRSDCGRLCSVQPDHSFAEHRGLCRMAC